MREAYQHLADFAENEDAFRAECAERRQRNRLAEVLTPKPTQSQPVVEKAAVLRRVERTAAAPAPASVTEAWAAYIQDQLRAFSEIVGEEIGSAEREARRERDEKIGELRAEIAVLRAEIKVRNEVEVLREQIEQLRGERRLRVVP
jgi:hypothetical protein